VRYGERKKKKKKWRRERETERGRGREGSWEWTGFRISLTLFLLFVSDNMTTTTTTTTTTCAATTAATVTATATTAPSTSTSGGSSQWLPIRWRRENSDGEIVLRAFLCHWAGAGPSAYAAWMEVDASDESILADGVEVCMSSGRARIMSVCRREGVPPSIAAI